MHLLRLNGDEFPLSNGRKANPMLRISVSNPLPPRPARPSADELTRVFGGANACANQGYGCGEDKDCCLHKCQNRFCA